MNKSFVLRNAAAVIGSCLCVSAAWADVDGQTISGEKLLPEHIGPQQVFSLTELAEREKIAPPVFVDRRDRNGAFGLWAIPNVGGSTYPASGQKNLVNKWGDAQMGIGFPGRTNVEGAFFTAQGTLDTSAAGLRAVAYRDGVEVASSEWLWDLGAEPQWLSMGFAQVDRIIIEACAKSAAGAFYGMDDFTFSAADPAGDDAVTEPTVLDFEDVQFKTTMTGSNYAGLVWESGGGAFGVDPGVPSPVIIPMGPEGPSEADGTPPIIELGSGDGLSLLRTFQGMTGFDNFTSFPSDCHGAIGPNHFVEVVNSTIAIFRKSDGVRIQTLSLGAILPGTSGDPRVLFDHHSGRYVMVASDFSTRLQIAVSRTNDPTGLWFGTSFVVSAGTDAGTFPDYPTLGVDANGFYIGFFPAGGAGKLTLIAIDKAPLIAPAPSLVTVTFFRNLPFERAFAPAYTYGNPPGEYIISTSGANTLRIRRINPPLTAPTLTTLGTVPVAGYSDPPDAPQAGGVPPADTIDARLINAVYRDGFLWTTHTVNVAGFAAVRWYQTNPSPLGTVQQGTIGGSVRSYYFPSLSVNQTGAMVLGFSGSNSGEFIGAWYSGRNASDPAGTVSVPFRYRTGLSSINNIDDIGRNRWGDYSNTSVDPSDDRTFWTIQGYAHSSGQWGTQGAVVGFNDCNTNGIPDECELNCATCANAPGCGTALDCNGNSTPDACDIASGNSADCNTNGVPDSCEIAGGAADCDADGVLDSCELLAGTGTDCNTNGVLDNCDLAGGAPDCNDNALPDTCDIASGTSKDCNTNTIPDECDISEFVNQTSGDLTPIGSGSPQSFTFLDVPEAITQVTLTFTASADLSTPTELFTIQLNGQVLGDVFVIANDCANPPNVEAIIVPAAQFNTLVNANGDDALIDVLPSVNVNANQCSPPSFVRINLSYTGLGAAGDANGNGIPDECEGGVPGDMNCDGLVTVSDIGGFVLALTDPAAYAAQFPDCNILNGDITGDGNVTVSDIGPFVQLLTGGTP